MNLVIKNSKPQDLATKESITGADLDNLLIKSKDKGAVFVMLQAKDKRILFAGDKDESEVIVVDCDPNEYHRPFVAVREQACGKWGWYINTSRVFDDTPHRLANLSMSQIVVMRDNATAGAATILVGRNAEIGGGGAAGIGKNLYVSGGGAWAIGSNNTVSGGGAKNITIDIDPLVDSPHFKAACDFYKL